jgi:endonuclease YncB( thermonuclease family)
LIFLMFFSSLALAGTQVKYLRNYDGDTITFDIGTVRVLGIDSGELNSKKPCERQSGLLARDFVKNALKNAKIIHLTNHKRRDIYQRILANVEYDGKDLKKALLDNNLAIPYVPKKRQKVNWCKILEKRK